MSVAQKLPKVAPCSIQTCPLCGEDKILVTRGFVRMSKDTDPEIFPDRGYSFCNCQNIWFTNTENIDLAANKEHVDESVDVVRWYMNRGLIFNQGYQRNRVFCHGPAPETQAEFFRLGFVSDAFPVDLIWSFHKIQRAINPLQVLGDYFNNLNPGGYLFVAMPDPYFIEFESPYEWRHWLLRENHIMWDMDSFCDAAEKIGFTTLMKKRNCDVQPCQDMHLIFKRGDHV